METISGRSFTKQGKNNKMINCMRAWNHLQETSDHPLNIETIKKTHKIMMDGKYVLVRKYRKSPVFSAYHIFASAGHIGRYK